MQNYNFLPLWYRNKMEKKEKFKFKICIFIMLAIIITSGIKYFKYEKEIDSLKIIAEFNSDKVMKERSNKEKSEAKKHITANTFGYFKEYESGKIFFDCLEISGKEVYLESSFMNIKTAREMLEYVEKNKDYKIKSIDIEDVKENKVVVKMRLEVKDDEKKL
ncbi:hypothetical protein GOM49_08585 [Clostridium bovifaecis]|uniref:Uncharacterized protein n=1 Tax=Clostridium bovifaecis TaxID=2184719 RepID=A0A6I6EXX6_9CLOT|nr:hypothetical protein GOM49_08585 [Clostridium bovifaecis]